MKQGFNGGPPVEWTVILGMICALLLLVLVIMIFYLLTLQKALNRVAPHNRLAAVKK